MKLVVLDGYTENPGDLSWEALQAFGEVTVYDRTSYVDAPIIAERLQDTYGSRGTLDHGSQKCSCQHTEKWIGKAGQDTGKFRHICQGFYRSAHSLHSGHQNGKAKKDRSYILLFLTLAEHDKDHTDKSQYRSESGRFTQLNKKIAAFDTGKA